MRLFIYLIASRNINLASTASIPPLLDGQKIADWEPKFRASVISLEERAAVRLLPVYVNRGMLEERVVLDAIKKETLDDAFQLLKNKLDPAIDIFEATDRFRQLLIYYGLLENQYTIFYTLLGGGD